MPVSSVAVFPSVADKQSCGFNIFIYVFRLKVNNFSFLKGQKRNI